MNKLDRPGRDPLELLDELERVLGIGAYPMNWPLGNGSDFKGVWDRRTRLAYFFERTVGGMYRAPVETVGLDDPVVRDRMSEATYRTVREEVDMLDGAGADFDAEAVRAGMTTPVYFGSALNNFGVQLLLDGFLDHSLPPTARRSAAQAMIEPVNPAFTGFVFKIQANMDPLHRDRIAFVRVVSGKFDRNMQVTHARTGKIIRLSAATRLFGQERETVDEAYPGDVIGIISKDAFAIGDTLTEDPGIVFDEIPRFAPECFATIRNPTPSGFKRFRTGLDQLLQEGVVQRYELTDTDRKATLLGAVGPLQFEIVKFRLESEYGAASVVESAPWTVARWLAPDVELDAEAIPYSTRLATDSQGRRVLLFPDEWNLRHFTERHPDIRISDRP
jgi:peptide chain release factor 3